MGLYAGLRRVAVTQVPSSSRCGWAGGAVGITVRTDLPIWWFKVVDTDVSRNQGNVALKRTIDVILDDRTLEPLCDTAGTRLI